MFLRGNPIVVVALVILGVASVVLDLEGVLRFGAWGAVGLCLLAILAGELRS